MALIVSLTSTSARLAILRHTLLSLQDQSLKPDRLVVCLSKEPYLSDEGITELPEWLKNMVKKSEVDVKWVKNIGPYRKLLPIYQQASDEDWIVTCDDDVIYGANWLKSLVEAGKQYPAAIVCGRARRPARNPWKGRQSYVNWPLVPGGSVGDELVPIGIAGVLYRKPLLDSTIMLSDDFKNLAPRQDDLWFNLARKVVGTTVYVTETTNDSVFPVDAPGALSATNVVTKTAGWDHFIKAIWGRLLVKFKGFLGISVCGNDIAIRNLEEYSKRLARRKLD